MSIDSATGQIDWTPSVSDLGFNPVTVRVTNGFSSATQSFTIAVSTEANTTPVFTSSPPIDGSIGALYEYTPAVLDPDSGQTHPYNLFSAPLGMTIDTASGLISWTPAADQGGGNPVSIGVSDGFATATQIFSIFVAGPGDNVAPLFTSSPPLSAVPGEPYQYTASAIDPDSASLTYSLFTGPDGMAIDAATGAVTWTPSSDQDGANAVSIGVTDGVATTTQVFNITVGDGGDGDGGCNSSDTDTGNWLIVIGAFLMLRRRRAACVVTVKEERRQR
jgi:hypothetical protein